MEAVTVENLFVLGVFFVLPKYLLRSILTEDIYEKCVGVLLVNLAHLKPH